MTPRSGGSRTRRLPLLPRKWHIYLGTLGLAAGLLDAAQYVLISSKQGAAGGSPVVNWGFIGAFVIWGLVELGVGLAGKD